MTDTAAVIVAAGRGSRVGGETPKQWRLLGDRMVVEHCLSIFAEHPRISQLVLVIHPDDRDQVVGFEGWPIKTVHGADTRRGSVLVGLRAIAGEFDHVLIHDAARPFLSTSIIDEICDALEHNDGAAPALPVVDALWLGSNSFVTACRDRKDLFRAQTPQGFSLPKILAAHLAHDGDAADDVAVALAMGLSVKIVDGEETNFKITHEEDFTRAESVLKLRQCMDIRVGNGYDVHRFCEGSSVILCGISIPYSHRLQGHSDADVAMHAVTDAIYGALALGDIGQHFPPSDPQWRDAASQIFLQHAANLAASENFRITNVDCTIICEEPKIGPYAAQMRASLAKIMGIAIGAVSVKATTSERLGFVGRREGIASLATATLAKL
ncbi:MAG: bifunctional 2-C-methyl-D-erythritol 4-phosphate cytidylyltransferase/2-C-methyl-D-erythritol 2,4-cyclodiphosphate synthase [Aestuariivita sp.]|nr:bifunctional 2-C-methyl-D-erythritol 4-phosphate cytidylyltransferase/2-C-methyl-D-erythritol 2,4-cyclodiphosphate synthase [Aestuariivita sp.]MCY4347063.1 bifunctional 2-C-methyl-D-erythritol 4-phosphate cytidylyltransferase/2-C-methyl-D-erythritol 2,4-cyclodiphosphate synthase [Aestuariivita sp.]